MTTGLSGPNDVRRSRTGGWLLAGLLVSLADADQLDRRRRFDHRHYDLRLLSVHSKLLLVFHICSLMLSCQDLTFDRMRSGAFDLLRTVNFEAGAPAETDGDVGEACPRVEELQ